MPNSKEREIERHALLLEIAGKVDVIYQLLTSATIASEPVKEKKSERKNSKKTKKTE